MRTRLAAVLCALLLARPAHSQVRVDALTEVRSIRFSGVKAVPERKLRDLILTRDRGTAYGLRVALGKIPFVPGPAHRPFSPLQLQQDVVRLRNRYAASGFTGAEVHYTVRRDDAKNLLDITFVIDEGAPLVLAGVAISPWDSLSTLPVPERERRSWDRMVRSLQKLKGRVEFDELQKGRKQLGDWWRNRGYPRTFVSPRVLRDTVRSELRIDYRVYTGAFSRFGDARIEGNQQLSETAVRKRLTFDPGDPYSARALEQSEQDLRELDIIRVAHVEVPSLAMVDSARAQPAADSLVSSEGDSVLAVRVRITEAEPRLISGDLGYVTDAGLSSEARWRHGNFTGGGRTLTLTGLAQTGWLAVVDNPDVRYRGAISFAQPGFMLRHMSAVLSPFIEHRDDSQDRSTQVGLNTTLVYRIRQFQTVSLDYQIAQRRIAEYRFGDLATGEIDLLTFLTQASQGALDSAGSNLRSSRFTLSGTMGSLDDPANPRRGAIVRPAIQVTAPSSLSSTEYWRLDASANAYWPVGRRVLSSNRVTVGQLFPFGKSLPGPGEDPRVKLLQLRDVMFTAGGTGDVRGWENRLLGPKVPDVRYETVNGTQVPHVDGYVPFGGLGRISFSSELGVPFPFLGPNFGFHAFLDGGRVWTDDARYDLQGDPHGQEHVFFATGGGVDVRTPVGPIRVSVGYKLNPSLTDLVDAADLYRAALAGTPFDALPQHNSRRWQWHLTIGSSY